MILILQIFGRSLDEIVKEGIQVKVTKYFN